ncbi:MAG: hypothetical protein C0609_10690 [Deltaproteobacteria bacterium]|nr:MAG: hypothetical protein C0609_10690 [Deltaproteobacteria bacterium]
MAKSFRVFLFISMVFMLTFTVAGMDRAFAEDEELRSGAVVDVAFEGLYTYITAKDDAGKTFFVVTEICKVTPDARLDVIRADQIAKMNIPPLGGEVSDVYLAQLIKLDGREVIGTTNEGFIPQGCKILE